MIQKAFGDNAMRAAQIKVWHKSFKDGQESVESDLRLEGLPQAQHLRTFTAYGLRSIKSGDPGDSAPTAQIYHPGPSGSPPN